MPLWRRSSRRLGWLSVNIVLNVAAASIIAFYEETLASVIALAVFLPIISDMSGCSGNQAIAVSMRELALGLINPSDVWRTWRKELWVGLINGVVLGALIGGVAFVWKSGRALEPGGGLGLGDQHGLRGLHRWSRPFAPAPTWCRSRAGIGTFVDDPDGHVRLLLGSLLCGIPADVRADSKLRGPQELSRLLDLECLLVEPMPTHHLVQCARRNASSARGIVDVAFAVRKQVPEVAPLEGPQNSSRARLKGSPAQSSFESSIQASGEIGRPSATAERCPGLRISSGRSSGMIVSPSHRSTDLSATLINSRTLPGQS